MKGRRVRGPPIVDMLPHENKILYCGLPWTKLRPRQSLESCCKSFHLAALSYPRLNINIKASATRSDGGPVDTLHTVGSRYRDGLRAVIRSLSE